MDFTDEILYNKKIELTLCLKSSKSNGSVFTENA